MLIQWKEFDVELYYLFIASKAIVDVYEVLTTLSFLE